MAKKDSKIMLDRPPIVAVMGHVDHGKTSLLDTIRHTDVQASEVGGITQNTRAHQIEHKNQKITFIDTPGHEAFTEMRSRGAKFTDMVLLVVAADDGIQPQTKESIKFAKNSGVPILVAINKIDLPGANPSKVKQELTQQEVLVEEFGGDVMSVEVSALKNTNIEELLESILLQAEVMELKSNKVAQGTAEGVILESLLDNAMGPVSLILVKAGEIEVGDYAVYPGKSNSVRAINTDKGDNLVKAGESAPVTIVGLDDVLPTGEVILFEKDQSKAQKMAKSYEETREEEEVQTKSIDSEDNLDFLAELLGDKQDEEEKQFLQVVLKTDTQGTLEAVRDKLAELGTDDIGIRILSSATGNITEKDVITAKNSRGIVLGFQVQTGSDVEAVAKREKVLVRSYSIIYKLLEEAEMVIQSMIEPEEEIEEVAKAKVKQVFELNNGSFVAGCEVIKGTVVKGYSCYLARGGEEIGEGKITSLKQHKEEVKNIKKGQECGIIIEPSIDFQKGDEIICYKVVKS